MGDVRVTPENLPSTRVRRLGASTLLVGVILAIACNEVRQEEPSVNLDEVRFHSGTRLKVVVQRSGTAEVPYGIYDSQLETRCHQGTMGDGSRRCIPMGATVAYRSPDCSDPIVVYAADACNDELPRFATKTDLTADACATTTQVFAVGEAIEALPTLYNLVDGVCQREPTYDGYRVSALGASIASGELAKMDTLEVPRGDALSVTYVTSADGFRHLAYGVTDRVHAMPCYPTRNGHCLPSGNTLITDYYGDAACTGEGGLFVFTEPVCAPPLPLGTRYAVNACEAERYFEVGGPASAWQRDGAGACAAAGEEGRTYATAGREVPLDELPAVKEVDDGVSPVRVRLYMAADAPLIGYGDFIDDAGLPCYPLSLESGVDRCVPSDTMFVSDGPGQVYADAACNEPLALAPPAAACDSNVAPLPRYIQKSFPSDNRCTTSFQIFERGEEVSGAGFMRNDGGTCVSIGPLDERTFRVGALVPEDRFVRVEELILD